MDKRYTLAELALGKAGELHGVSEIKRRLSEGELKRVKDILAPGDRPLSDKTVREMMATMKTRTNEEFVLGLAKVS